MAKKKKDGKKKSGKKKSGKTSDKSGNGKLEDIFNELSKEFYLLQIRDLETKIARYQDKCDTLELRNKDVEYKFERQATDKKEIVSFLKKQLEQRSDEIADLREKLISLQQAKELERDKYELDLTTLRMEMRELKDQLTSENMVLCGKLASLEDFRVQREDLLNKFSEMEELLKTQEQSHKEQIYQLERKAVVDKDRLKKEMIIRVNTVAAEFRKVSNKQMADTTKRAIRENVVINTQLTKMSDKTMELISENDDMKVKTKSQKQHLDILEDNEKELIKKNYANEKVIRMLTDKARGQEVLIQEYSERESEYQIFQIEYNKMKDDLKRVAQENETLSNKRLELERHCSKVEKEKEDGMLDKEYLVGILGDATGVLKQALQHKDPVEESSQTEVKNKNLLYKVVDLLNVAVEMGIGIHPEEFAVKRKLYEKRKKYNGLPSTMTLKTPNPHAHYKLGDLGIVPPPPASPLLRKPKEKPNPKKTNDKVKDVLLMDQRLTRSSPRLSKYQSAKGPPFKLPTISPV